MKLIYLDSSATTPLLPEVVEAMTECYSRNWANPSSQHQMGRRARQALEDARDGIAEILGMRGGGGSRDRLVFTSGGTEANNLALFGIADAPAGRLVVSSVEHPSVLRPAEELARTRATVVRLPVDPAGCVRLDALREALAGGARLVSIMAANHETGVLQPLPEVAAICRDARVPLHVDAVQSVAKQPMDFLAWGAAAVSISAHKFHGPPGIGALLLLRDLPLRPLLYGGFQQQSVRPGTESVALAVGMFTALQLWERNGRDWRQRLASLRDQFERLVGSQIADARFHGNVVSRAPHISSAFFPGVDRQALAMALDLAGVACSTGSACASGSSEPSPVLQAMGLPDDVVRGSLRFSFSVLTTLEDVVQAAERIVHCYQHLRNLSESRKPASVSRNH